MLNTLDSDNHTNDPELKLLGKWFKNLEEMVGKIVRPKVKGQTYAFFMKRRDTHRELVAKLKDEFSGTMWKDIFPID